MGIFSSGKLVSKTNDRRVPSHVSWNGHLPTHDSNPCPFSFLCPCPYLYSDPYDDAYVSSAPSPCLCLSLYVSYASLLCPWTLSLVSQIWLVYLSQPVRVKITSVGRKSQFKITNRHENSNRKYLTEGKSTGAVSRS